MEVSKSFQECFKDISRVFQHGFKDVVLLFCCNMAVMGTDQLEGRLCFPHNYDIIIDN